MLNSVSSATNAAPVSSPLALASSAKAAFSLESPMGSPLTISVNTLRSAVKSVRTLTTEVNSSTATRSEEVICSFRNFRAAPSARSCSGICIFEKSKKSAIRRLS